MAGPSILHSYASFTGRITRGSFWPLFTLASIVVVPLLITALPLGFILCVFIILPLAGAATRRMHDVGLSGGWLLPLIVIPMLMLGILVLANSMFTLILVVAIDPTASDGDISSAAVSAETVLAWTFGASLFASLVALAWHGTAGPNQYGDVVGGIEPDGEALPDHSQTSVDPNWRRRPEEVHHDREH